MSDAPVPDIARRRRFLGDVARAQRGALMLALVAGAVRQGGFLALPWCLQHAVDDGLVPRDNGILLWWASAVVGASVVQVLGVCCWDWWANLADARTGILVRGALAERIVGVSGDGVGSGDLLLRAGRDVDLVRVWVHGLPTWSVIATTVVVLVPGLFALNPLLLAVAIATVPCLIVIGIVHPRRYEVASQAVAEAHGRRANQVEHIVGSAVTSRGIGGGPVLDERHRDSSAALSLAAVRATDRLARWQAWGVGVPTLAVAVGLLIGVIAVVDDQLSVGGLVAFSTWMGTIGVAVEVGLMRWAQTLDARVAVDRLLAVLGPEGLSVGNQTDAVIDRTPVDALDVNGVLAGRGKLLAVTGPTGGGKSTLLRRLAAGEHAAQTVLVPQRPIVLATTVRENLTLGDEVPDEQLRSVLFDVGLTDEFELDDMLVDGADGLSGGQIQRLALGRALVTDPPVLLLDDVTSGIDAATEAHILTTLKQRSSERIVVVVSHRSAVLSAADRVVTVGVPA